MEKNTNKLRLVGLFYNIEYIALNHSSRIQLIPRIELIEEQYFKAQYFM